ncbi:uncharacterized protein METZ01_LOCUS98818 [marine metagenome]|uniref:Uncharacterized protein n=1 Tax=marine metagenome TaxID=408172 RepID=A0A381W0F0_9ZZZZ
MGRDEDQQEGQHPPQASHVATLQATEVMMWLR